MLRAALALRNNLTYRCATEKDDVTMATSQADRSAEFRRRRDAELRVLRADRDRPNAFCKAAFAVAQCMVLQPKHARDPSKFLSRDDHVAAMVIERANQTPGSTTVASWALELAQTSLRDFLTSLGQYGAAARLIEQAVPAEVNPYDTIKYPVRAAGPTLPSFVGENDAIPVRSAAFSLISIGPARKLASIVAWSRELGKRSDAESIFARMLAEDMAAGVDAALLSTSAATSAAPAGLLNGTTALVGYAGGDETALLTDFAALAAAVGVGGSGNVTYIVAPERLAKLKVLQPLLAQSLDIVASAAVPTARVVAIEGPALMIATDPAPDIMRSEEGVLHMSDVPLEIVADNTTVADPTRSLYQSASAALRVIHAIAFTKRRAAAAAYLDGATW